jgi:uncharacterized membrane protein
MSARPAAAVSSEGPAEGLKLVLPGRSMPAGAGWDWITEGWTLFARAPVMWIIALVILFVLALVVNIIPVIGSIAFQLLQPVFAGGFVIACRSLEKGGEFELEHLFAGFKRNFAGLLLLGIILLIALGLCVVVFIGIAGLSVLGVIFSGGYAYAYTAAASAGLTLALGALVMLALMIPLLAAYWFAPALVVMHNVSPLTAMKESLFACMRNFLSFVVVYGIIMSLFFIVAIIPLGLGLLVWIPVTITSTYIAYRQIFTDDEYRPIPIPVPPDPPRAKMV